MSTEAPGRGGAGPALSASAPAFTPGSTASSRPDSSSRRRRGRSGGNGEDSNSNRGARAHGGRSGNDGGRGGGASPGPVPAASTTATGGHTQAASQEGTTRRSRGARGGRSRGRGRGRVGGRGGAPPRGNSRHAAQGGRGAAEQGGGGGDDDGDDGPPLCVVCASEIEFFAVGECNHPGRCSTCAMRSRVLLKDRSCPECKTVLDRLVVAELPASGEAPRFESFNLWGNVTGPGSKFDDESDMIFHECEEHHDSLLRARDLYCPVEGCTGPPSSVGEGGGRGRGRGTKRGIGGREIFADKGALSEHMKGFHQRYLCLLCVEGRPLFLSEQEVFTASDLRKHEARVEGGHPLCRFCSKRFFDNTALYDHMTGTHINCHLCPEENQHRYFRGEPQLRDHLRTSHFLCDRGECRRHGMVSAFNTPQEFQAHLLEDHGVTDRRAVAAGGVGFNVRRAARDGSGLHGSGGSVAEANTPIAPGESFAAPDPEVDLAAGVVVPVPATRGRRDSPSEGAAAAGAGAEAEGALAGAAAGAGPRSRHQHQPQEGGGGGGEWPRGTAAAATGGGGGGGGGGEAFPSLPAAPLQSGRAPQERHAFSLVGKTLRPRAPGGTAGHGGEAGSGGGSGRGGGGGGGGGSEEEEKERRQLLRNQRLADALGIRAALGAGAAIGGAKVGTTASGAAVAIGIGDGLDAIREHLTRTNYSTYLVAWARDNRTALMKLERRLAELVADRKGTSTQLKPMPSVDRKAAHELAAHYGLVSQSFDLEPKRYVSVIKQKGCRLPSRLLSTAARDPAYTGTDDALVEGAASAPSLERTITNPNPRATALLGAAATASGGGGGDVGGRGGGGGGGGGSVGLSPPVGGERPRTSTVTSISSADPLAVDPAAAAAAAAAAESENKKPFHQRSKRRGVLPPGSGGGGGAAAASAAEGGAPTSTAALPAPATVTAVAAATPAAAAAAAGGDGKNTASDKKAGAAAGCGGATGASPSFSATGNGTRDEDGGATAAAAAAAGPANPECLLVFHSVQAGLGGGDAVLASVRKIVPARTVVGVRQATAAETSASGVPPGARGSGGGGAGSGGALVMEFTSELNARRAWEKIEKEAEQLVAAARVTRTNYHAPFRAKPYPSSPPATAAAAAAAGGGGGGGGDKDAGFDIVRDNWDDSSEDEEEEDGMGAAAEGGTGRQEEGGEQAVNSAAEGDGSAGQPQDQEIREQQHHRNVDADADAGNSSDKEDEEEAAGMAAGGQAPSSPPDAAATAAATAVTATAPVVAFSLPAAAAAPAPATGKRQSKWGNSAIKGRLSRPSDGRATTVEQEAAARQERLEKLRRLEEARRENRQRRDQDKRAERANAGKLDAHAFMWENLGGGDSSSSSESSTEGGDDDGGDAEDNGSGGAALGDDIIGARQGSRRESPPPAAEAAGAGAKSGQHGGVAAAPTRQEGAAYDAYPAVGGGGGGGGGGVALAPEHRDEEGWACESCTFWNAVEGGGGVADDGDAQRPRCGVCEAEGPRNARSPWLPA